jgi:hypothetical protein
MIAQTIIIIRMAFPTLICLILFGVFSTYSSFGQASIVRNRLQSLAMGKTQEAKKDLPDLLVEYPDDPGVLFLHASVLEDMSKSLLMYQRIVKEKPDCEWADDAQWSIVHYHAMKRDTAKAREEMLNFRTAYPKSELLLTAYNLLRATIGGAGKYKKQETQIQTKTSDATKEKEQKVADKKEDKKDKTPKSENENLIIIDGDKKENPKPKIGTLFTLQVGVFKTRAAAQEEFANYQAKRMKVYLTDRKLPDSSIRYVITIGEYTSRANAEAGIALVKDACNCTPMIVQKLNQ